MGRAISIQKISELTERLVVPQTLQKIKGQRLKQGTVAGTNPTGQATDIGKKTTIGVIDQLHRPLELSLD